MSIQSNIQSIRTHIPSHVRLVCVSKFNPNESILEAYETGERIFGESKVQELCGKYETLPKGTIYLILLGISKLIKLGILFLLFH